MKTLNTIQAVPGGWTITDSHLSPDNDRMVYAHMVRLLRISLGLLPTT